jgi:putative transposase
MKASQASKTIRQRVEYRALCSEWFARTQALYNAVVQHYFEVLQAHPAVLDLSSREALTALEALTHTTKRNPHPVMPLSAIAPQIPAMFRRAAIHAALGMVHSFQSNLARWQAAKAKAQTQGKPFHLRPPVPPRAFRRSVTLYTGMWQHRSSTSIVLKLYDGKSWRWVRFALTEGSFPTGGKQAARKSCAEGVAGGCTPHLLRRSNARARSKPRYRPIRICACVRSISISTMRLRSRRFWMPTVR